VAEIGGASESVAAGIKVLLVEDNDHVASDMTEMLEQAGYEVLGPAATVAAALAVIASTKPDAALLDLNLGGEMSYTLADALVAGGIPFIITSGFIDELPEKYRQHIVLPKPFMPKELFRCLKQAVPAA